MTKIQKSENRMVDIVKVHAVIELDVSEYGISEDEVKQFGFDEKRPPQKELFEYFWAVYHEGEGAEYKVVSYDTWDAEDFLSQQLGYATEEEQETWNPILRKRYKELTILEESSTNE